MDIENNLYNEIFMKIIYSQGYKGDCQMMKDIDLRCHHHKFNSVGDFGKYIEIMRRQELKNDSNDDSFMCLIGRGFCRQCSVHIVSNLMEITDYPTLIKNVNSVLRPDDSELKLVYFTNCMHYISAANFIFNQSDLWIPMLLYLSVLVDTISSVIRLKISNNGKIEFQIQNITLILFQIARNIGILKYKHWKFIQKSCLMQWFSFIELQLKF
eukprot:219915_1